MVKIIERRNTEVTYPRLAKEYAVNAAQYPTAPRIESKINHFQLRPSSKKGLGTPFLTTGIKKRKRRLLPAAAANTPDCGTVCKIAVFSKIGVIAQIKLARRKKRTKRLPKSTLKGLKSECLISFMLRKYEPTTISTIPITPASFKFSPRKANAKRAVNKGLKDAIGAKIETGACFIAVYDKSVAKTFKKADPKTPNQKTQSVLGIPPAVARVIRSRNGTVKNASAALKTDGDTPRKTCFEIIMPTDIQIANKSESQNHIPTISIAIKQKNNVTILE